MIEIQGLSKSFGKVKVLEDIQLRADKGIYGLLGPNGAGKTTLLRCMTGLYPYKGEILFYGKAVGKSRTYLQKVGYVPQKFGVFPYLTVEEMMYYFANLKGFRKKEAKPMIESCLEKVNMTESLRQKAGKLSGGMLRRIAIAQALLNEPEIILLDEPTSGLDPEERMRLKMVISRLAKETLVILSTHIVEDIDALCNHVLVMNKGKLHAPMTCDEIREIARDKVYELTMEELEALSEKVYVTREYEHGGKIVYRVLSQGISNHVPQPPTIEDGYLCLLHAI